MAFDFYVDFHRLYFIGNNPPNPSLVNEYRKSRETLYGDDLGLGMG